MTYAVVALGVVCVLSLAVSGWAAARSVPARVFQRLAAVEEIAGTAHRNTEGFKAEKLQRDTAYANFLDQAEDLLETAQRKQRRAAASLSKAEAKERSQPAGGDTPAAPAVPLTEDDQKALLAATHLQ